MTFSVLQGTSMQPTVYEVCFRDVEPWNKSLFSVFSRTRGSLYSLAQGKPCLSWHFQLEDRPRFSLFFPRTHMGACSGALKVHTVLGAWSLSLRELISKVLLANFVPLSVFLKCITAWRFHACKSCIFIIFLPPFTPSHPSVSHSHQIPSFQQVFPHTPVLCWGTPSEFN